MVQVVLIVTGWVLQSRDLGRGVSCVPSGAEKPSMCRDQLNTAGVSVPYGIDLMRGLAYPRSSEMIRR